jgi:hypothetical protein
VAVSAVTAAALPRDGAADVNLLTSLLQTFSMDGAREREAHDQVTVMLL